MSALVQSSTLLLEPLVCLRTGRYKIDKKESINFLIRKPGQLFNLEDKNASLRAKVTQDKKEFDKLKAENSQLNARLEKSINTACIQSEKMEEKIRKLTKKLDKAQNLQEQLTLARQNAFEAHDKLN